MDIEIKFFATLRQYLPEGNQAVAMQLNVSDDATVAQVLDTLKIPKDEVKLIFVNSVKALLDQRLKAGDRVGVFPPVAGG